MENLNEFKNKSKEFDELDSISNFKDLFHNNKNLIYFDGNSLGKLPLTVIKNLNNVVQDEWGNDLIQSWNKKWINLPNEISTILSKILCCNNEEMFIGESTSNNLFKLLYSLCNKNLYKGIYTDILNFPSDIYICQEISKSHNIPFNLISYNDENTCDIQKLEEIITNSKNSIFVLSLVSYKSSYKYPLKSLNKIAKESNSTIIWDLSHAVGAIHIDLEESHTEYAIGCTYKFLNCGPGSPAFIYVNRKKIKEINSPINGWFSHENPFDFKQQYSQTHSIEKFRSGTPHILSMSTMIDSLNITLLAGTKNIDNKREKMINFFNQLFKSYLESRNFKLESPKDLSIIGSHVTISHSESWRICKSLINPQKGKKIIVDFRPNNYLRIAITPLYTSFDEILTLVVRLVEIFDTGEFKLHDNSREIVT